VERSDSWCHAAASGAAEPDVAPDLVVVTRITNEVASVMAPTSACLSDEPALRQLARVGLEPR
jgi:hypothetical protein